MKNVRLMQFRDILKSTAFQYISDPKVLQEIEFIALNKINAPDGQEDDYVRTMGRYVQLLETFYEEIKGERIRGLKEPYQLAISKLSSMARLLEEANDKRVLVKTRHAKKFFEDFVDGLNGMADRLPDLFKDLVPMSKVISAQEFAKYILSDSGYGSRYRFNNRGKNNAFSKMFDLTIPELAEVQNLLSDPKGHVFYQNGWTIYGNERDLVRILIVKKRFGKDLIAYVYRTKSEFNAYKNQLANSPDQSQFAFAQ